MTNKAASKTTSKAPRKATGTLYGIGVGPGDPRLITLRAHDVLTRAPVVCVPKSKVESESFALSIIQPYLNQDKQEVIELLFPMTKDQTLLQSFWETAAKAVHERLVQGQDVACIAQGDPLFYSTFTALLRLIRLNLPNVKVEVIPGVTSVSAVTARLATPLTTTRERLAVLPATYDAGELRHVMETFDTVVLMKVHSVMDRVLETLKVLGLKDRAVFVSWCGTSREEVVTDLDSLRGRPLDYFSLLIIRKNPWPQ